jgi:hypothetical protein
MVLVRAGGGSSGKYSDGSSKVNGLNCPAQGIAGAVAPGVRIHTPSVGTDG